METQKIKLHIENYISEVENAIHEPIVDRDVGRITIDAAKSFYSPVANVERGKMEQSFKYCGNRSWCCSRCF